MVLSSLLLLTNFLSFAHMLYVSLFLAVCNHNPQYPECTILISQLMT